MATGALARLAALRCRPVSVPLGEGPPPEQVVRTAAGADGLVCLVGSWAGGGALLASDPLLVLPADADPIAALAVQPRLTVEEPDVVGGGWFGWLGFDGPSRLAFYDHLLRYADGAWSFEALWSEQRDGLLHARRDELAALLELDAGRDAWQVGEFGGAERTRHLQAVERAVESIRAGDIYQANVCTRLTAPFGGSAVGLFAASVAAVAPAFGAYLDDGTRAVVSLSPELFLRRRGRDVVTAPIKGTWPRTGGEGPDALRRSAKDAAENVMIVDLMRNDLGRVCEIGTVRAAALLEVQPHPGVWHLVSTVAGRLRGDVTDGDLLAATFPPGSVTGAPKLRALDVIAELEAQPRGAYTGALGFASPSWGLELSVAIRTFEIATGRIELGVGGGVTADSVPMLEWRECLHKAAPLLGALGAAVSAEVATPDVPPTGTQLAGGLLETILAVDGVPLRLADHLARLDRSCRELYGAGLPDGVVARVRQAARASAPGRVALRVVASPALELTVSAAPAPAARRPSSAYLVTGRSGLWRHKWGDRSYLAGVEAAGVEAAGVPLFVAPDGAVLETSRGNVFLLAPDGTLTTPPLRDDLLPGVTRRALLDAARDAGRPTQLRPFDVAELVGSAAFWTSSLSGAVPIASVDGAPLPRRDDEIAELSAALVPLADHPFVR
ncbi:MAG: para-aminobenzoate synthetase / 4-amino-4-deoxychorismate lyase [Pseudonocardiales bacterium]|jgi:para-aminobenzoate synthetase/4-amino-4-deoxychorismate lyase|nr:para-aminobenzoate synthetase / 4-amino-4-deoxychorismate lyase [Pseudonocardiales bacterium]